MTDVRLDENDDLWYEAGDLDTVEGIEELAQSAGIAYDTALGEWAYDTAAGVSYFLITRPGATDAEIVAELRRVGMRIRGVTAVSEVVLTRDPVPRDLDADITLENIYGSPVIVEF